MNDTIYDVYINFYITATGELYKIVNCEYSINDILIC